VENYQMIPPVMDVATGEYGDVLFQLTSGIENGRLIYNEFSETIPVTPSHDGKIRSQNQFTWSSGKNLVKGEIIKN
jgi:hypothetical protein